jgi:hypothetical protein
MGLQTDDTTASAMLDAMETSIGTSPTLKMRTGAPPANCAAADSGTVVATIPLPSDWLNNAASRQKTKAGTWQDASADATGTAGHFRVYDSGGACRMQGNVTATGGGGVMTVDNTSFAAGQSFTVTSFSIADGNA